MRMLGRDGSDMATAGAEVQAKLRPIAEEVYVYEQLPGGWCLNNAGLVVAGGRSVLIDTAATEARARRLHEQTLQFTADGPDIVVNTHFHGDHVFGNSHFTPRATVVAAEGTRADMAEAGLGLRSLWPRVDWGETRLALPDVTFDDRLSLRVGSISVELLQVGPAHTAADVVAWIPERRILFTGDVAWSGVTPYVLMGSIDGSLRAIERMRGLRPEIVVAGHGPVAGPEVLDATEGYLRRCRDIAVDGLRRKLSPLDAARQAGLGPFQHWIDSERLVGNLHRAYAELDGLAPGARIDVAGSFREMVEFHGGLPHCAA